DLLDRAQARATFFVLGWVAVRHPDLVRALRDAGHEVASHGMWHRKVFHQTPEEFEEDVRASPDVLPEITAQAPTAYPPAPPTLRGLGFQDDSSVSPTTWISGRLEPEPFRAPTPDGDLRVFPVTTMRLFGERLPFTGGMGLRTSPYWYTAYFFERLNQRGV